MAGIEEDFFENAYDDGEPRPTRAWRVDFRCPEHSQSLIEADIVEVGSPYHRELKKQLKANGAAYLKRAPYKRAINKPAKKPAREA
jgi:hypothetical protein